MYCQFVETKLVATFKALPQTVWLADGSTRTSLYELPAEKLTSIGMVEYQEVIPEFDPKTQYPGVEYTFDHVSKTASPVILNKTAEVIKSEKESALKEALEADLKSGYLCSNGIRLKTEGDALVGFMRLLVGIMAFNPETVVIGDDKGIGHTVSKEDAMKMMAELFAFEQSLVSKKFLDVVKIKIEAIK